MTTKTELLPHQVEAVEKLRKLKVGALYMEMGTGKTRTALELIKLRMNVGKVDHVIWFCPCSVKANLLADIKKHSDLDEGPLTICGIETLSSSVTANMELINLVTEKRVFLVVDESNLVKNPSALRSRHIVFLAEKCQYKLILNGTPITRNEADLFNQWYLLDWRILGYRSYYSFAANHIEYDPNKPGRIRQTLNVDYLVEKISPYTYQVKKAECIKLPAKKYYSYGFYMTQEQEYMYETIIDALLSSVDEMRPGTIYRLFNAAQAICCGFGVRIDMRGNIHTHSFFEDPEDNPRIQCFLSSLDDIDGKCLIFCKYTQEINDIATLLNKKEPGSAVIFNGKLPLKKRNESLDKFRNEAKYMIANKNCGAYGLNLQFCHNIIYYSNDWDWGTRAQSEDRLHRFGQENDIKIIDIYAYGSIDVRIEKSLNRKERLVKNFKDEIKERQAKGESLQDILRDMCGKKNRENGGVIGIDAENLSD